ncbi:MAG: ATP-binding protein [Candidatus Sumerlaeia bacterium]
MTDFPVRYTCLADRAVLSLLRQYVSRAAEQCGFSGEDAIKIEMAVDEACSNVAEHAYLDGDDRRMITLQLDSSPEALTIHVIDHGRGGCPADFHPLGSIEEYCRLDRGAFGGLGLLIMRRFMDEMEVDSAPNAGTRVMLRKYRSEAA